MWWTHCNATRTWPEAPQVRVVLQADRMACRYGLGTLSSELAGFAPATPKKVWARVPPAPVPLPPDDTDNDMYESIMPPAPLPGVDAVKREVDEEDIVLKDLAAPVLPEPDLQGAAAAGCEEQGSLAELLSQPGNAAFGGPPHAQLVVVGRFQCLPDTVRPVWSLCRCQRRHGQAST